MINYIEIYPLNKQLVPYIESFVVLRLNTPEIDSKIFLPRPGASLLFSNIPIVVNNKVNDTSVVLGICSKSSIIKWKGTPSGHGLLVKFSPYGLSRFTNIPIPQIANTAISASKLLGNSLQKLHGQIMGTDDVSNQINLVEDSLAKRFIEPNEIDKYIFRLADTIISHIGYNSSEPLLQKIPLSQRHIERRFKELIGINMQTFNRICHFDNAKSLLMEQQSASLTEIGYRSGYFDQAHFSREFKRFTAHSPKSFFQVAPFYKLISNSKK